MRDYELAVKERRSILLNGLATALGKPGAVVWTYLANLGIALLFSLRLHAQLASMLDHSMAAERLNGAFDLGTVAAVFIRLGKNAPSTGSTQYVGVPVYFLIYFLLAPGALFCYRTGVRAKLGTMLAEGLRFFWRFVRIALLTALIGGLVLGPLSAIYGAWSAHVTETTVGVGSVYLTIPVLLLVALVACFVRLYFDMVEVYTVQLDGHLRPNGKVDRRVRKALIPAWKTMWRNLARALGSFIFTALIGLAVLAFCGWIALHTLAQPRVWPAFLLIQAAMLVSIFVRYWQRGMETVLAADFPLVVPVLVDAPVYPYVGERAIVNPAGAVPVAPVVTVPVVDPVAQPVVHPVLDPLPNPEPAVPADTADRIVPRIERDPSDLA